MILALAFTPDGKTLISGSVSGMIKLWNVTPAGLRTSLKGHPDGILSMALAADGKDLVSGSVDGTVKLWNLAAHQGPTVVQGPARTTKLLTFSADGNQVIAVDANGQLLRADARTGAPLAPLDVKGNLFGVFAADLAADGKWLATAGIGKGKDKGVDIWDIQAGKLVTSFGIRGQAWAVSISPDRGKLAVGTDRLQILELPSGKILHALTPFKERFMRAGNTFANRVTATAFSPDGKLLAVSSKDGKAALFDVETGKERAVFTVPSEVAGVAFTPDGKRLAVAAGQTVTIYDVQAKKEVLVLEGYSHQPAQMSFSPDGRRLATCGGLGELQHGTGVKLWDLATGQEVLTLASSKIAIRVAFSPTGERLAAAFSQNAASMFMASTSGETWIWDGTAAKNEP
jgi:WD40 repeat protein